MYPRKGILRPLFGRRIPPQGRQSWLQELGCKKHAHTHTRQAQGRQAGRQAGGGWGGGEGKKAHNRHFSNKSKPDQNHQA